MNKIIYFPRLQNTRTAEGIIEHEKINREIDEMFTDIPALAMEMKRRYELPETYE
jgi:hypothetical protein